MLKIARELIAGGGAPEIELSEQLGAWTKELCGDSYVAKESTELVFFYYSQIKVILNFYFCILSFHE